MKGGAGKVAKIAVTVGKDTKTVIRDIIDLNQNSPANRYKASNQ